MDHELNNKEWWRNSVAYIIYPPGFKDSNGDGLGDLKGIKEKLGYLRELGIDLIWICPIFASPMCDNGYDVSDYYAINEKFGTMEELDELIAVAHEKGIKVLLDFPMNHTSSKHAWFKEALADPNSKYRDYYYFRKGKVVDGKMCPPNNWKGFFATSVWERVGESDDYYLHLFNKGMPDVNWFNPALRQEFYAIAQYYLNKGVDGFRLDAVSHLSKDLSFTDNVGEKDINGLVFDSSRFSNREEIYGFLEEFRKEGCKGHNALLIGEAGGCISPQEAMRLVGPHGKGPLTMVFNFDTVWNNGNYGSIGKKDEEIKTDVLQLKHNFMRWYEVFHGNADMPLYWCNHDHPRVVSQYGNVLYREKSAKMLLLTLLFLYGTPFLFQGEEIGMSNFRFFKPEDFFYDDATISEVKEYRQRGFSDEEIAKFLSRASHINARGAIPWDGKKKNAGFSSADHLQVPFSEDAYLGVDVQSQMEDAYSILNFAQFAIEKRHNPILNDIVNKGQLEWVDPSNPDVFAYMHIGTKKMMVVSSFRDYDVDFPFYYTVSDLILHNYGEVMLEDHVLHLRPFETYLFLVK